MKSGYFFRKRRKILQNFFTGCCVIFTGDMPSGAEFHGRPLFAPMESKGMGSSSNHDSRICQFTAFTTYTFLRPQAVLRFDVNKFFIRFKFIQECPVVYVKKIRIIRNNKFSMFISIWILSYQILIHSYSA